MANPLESAPRTVGAKVDDGIVTAGAKAALMADENVKSIKKQTPAGSLPRHRQLR